jgi:hypothetical protein
LSQLLLLFWGEGETFAKEKTFFEGRVETNKDKKQQFFNIFLPIFCLTFRRQLVLVFGYFQKVFVSTEMHIVIVLPLESIYIYFSPAKIANW